ncbi:MAG: DUF1998 domain-containing protein [Gemmatimonadetes bacterium]|nr:DUF1998 domain-containing protein [Gemmatimonadota bacterium]
MGHRQIRLAQLIAPFGPGALYTDKKGTPHIVCGVDFWHHRSDITQGMLSCEEPSEFERFEPRLAALLGVSRFKLPPDFRARSRGSKPPPNADLFVPAQRFPGWYRHSKTGELRRFNLDAKRVPPAPDGRWFPVRFIAACAAGHLNEFPWRKWSGCTCLGESKLFLQDRGGADLSGIVVECKGCDKKRSLSGATQSPESGEQGSLGKAGIDCGGERPWLGTGASELCDAPIVGALINQTNLYFARTISSILLPDLQEKDPDVLRIREECANDSTCSAAKLLWDINQRAAAVAAMGQALRSREIDATLETIEAALVSLFDPKSVLLAGVAQPTDPDSDLLAFRRAEYNVLKQGINDRIRSSDLRVVVTEVPANVETWVERVQLVERLRETRVLYGFDRLEPSTRPLIGMPDSALTQLFRYPPTRPEERWLPAVEVFGEGIFINLREDAIAAWQERNEEWLKSRLSEAFVVRVAGQYQTIPPAGHATWRWASRYLLVHSLAHILINQLIFECGYGTASLRERLYVADDPTAPMAGFLIYTAAGDSEGTLGGLVELGRPERLGDTIDRALTRASWCSADPICSESFGGGGSRLANLAACHACILLPETSCETINHGLDRALVVGTPEAPGRGAFSELILEARQEI